MASRRNMRVPFELGQSGSRGAGSDAAKGDRKFIVGFRGPSMSRLFPLARGHEFRSNFSEKELGRLFGRLKTSDVDQNLFRSLTRNVGSRFSN